MSEQHVQLISSQPQPKASPRINVFVFVSDGDFLGVIHNGELIKPGDAMNRQASIVEAYLTRTKGAKPVIVEPVSGPADQVETISRIGQEQAAADQKGQG